MKLSKEYRQISNVTFYPMLLVAAYFALALLGPFVVYYWKTLAVMIVGGILTLPFLLMTEK